MQGQRQGSCCSPTTPAKAGRPAGGRGEPLPVINKGCCGGRDLGPIRDDEGPSAADLARFNRETITCPKCQAEMFDEAEICLSCGHEIIPTERKGVPWALATGVVLIGVLTLWIVI